MPLDIVKDFIKRNIKNKYIIVILKKAYGSIRYLENITRRFIISYKYWKNKDTLIPIENYASGSTEISKYWTGHTVRDDFFVSAKESLDYRKSVFDMYPKYREFADMDRQHDGEVILDYGCGPGNDLTWYTQMANPRIIIGMDVSMTSLLHSQFRMALHGVMKEKCRLILLDEAAGKIPLEDECVDFISCQGVLMHTSNPESILKEFHRVLKRNNDYCAATIMVYNKESIWWHLYAAYYLRFVDCSALSLYSKDQVANMSLEEIFRRSTDGPECPMARCWSPEEFAALCRAAGFSKVEYQGGYPNSLEPDLARNYLKKALMDERLEDEHKVFLEKVQFGVDGFPVMEGLDCCIGGTYKLWG